MIDRSHSQKEIHIMRRVKEKTLIGVVYKTIKKDNLINGREQVKILTLYTNFMIRRQSICNVYERWTDNEQTIKINNITIITNTEKLKLHNSSEEIEVDIKEDYKNIKI